MKTKITLFLILANLFVFTSCNKNSDVDGPLIGKWTLTEDTGTAYGSMSAYFDFRSDGKLYVTIGSEFDELMQNPDMKMSDVVSIYDYEYSSDKLVLTNALAQYKGEIISKIESYYCEFQVTKLTKHTLDMTCTKLEGSEYYTGIVQQIVIGHKYHLTK